jgi:hypothetical protein
LPHASSRTVRGPASPPRATSHRTGDVQAGFCRIETIARARTVVL